MRSLLLFLTASVALAQQFEVATIRATQLNLQAVSANRPAAIANIAASVGMKVNGNQVNFGFMSLRDLVTMAYEVKPTQVKTPDWMAQQRYDIQALMPEGADQKQIPAMLRALLAERFKMVAHKESLEQNVMALEVAKGGHKMKEAAPVDANAVPAAPPEGAQTATVRGQQVAITRGANGLSIAGGATGGMKMSMGADGQMHMELERVTMAQVADLLTTLNELPVVDRTGLTGEFQVSLDLALADMLAVARRAGATAGIALPGLAAGGAGMPAGLGASDPGGDISTTVAKLGLRLEKTKVTMDSVTVESAEKTPTEN